MCYWRHMTCDINLEGDIRKYIIAIIQSECMISTGGITITYRWKGKQSRRITNQTDRQADGQSLSPDPIQHVMGG